MAAVLGKVVIMGLGLMGGSLARSLKQTGFCDHITGHGHRDVSLKKGVSLGIIDSYSLDIDEALAGADMVVIATPVLRAIEAVAEVLPKVSRSTIVTDVASVKGSLLQAGIAACAGQVPPNLVLGHPIAGSHNSGVDASDADLYRNHRVILTPLPETDTEALAVVRQMWLSTGANVAEMNVAEHDAVLAATSHLPHMLAYALVDALASSAITDDIFAFAAGGFRDFSRIASSDPTMWRDIALSNRDSLLEAIDMYTANLAQLRESIASADSDALHDTFSRSKAVRDAFVAGSADS
ncbi:prephenate dehydrogenase/arogenate dehydrogenase family protein [Halieaceae bacterium IMCC14734]|uniref:Prephenate dehydrogenase/arogenate dehydrogenase family protein n=1 Tax=Candidatus Litorirhabdus singularis TaxID=2518993 RepID=A0ABT3TGN9_9GAMM|nr:prephenate dehydrogenase/arogenate dehydrogenase family protein [Candidatus Litorirhabdus singularis]MCX2981169.1 prephenate dehydrogenase/arogenate dehydrogenase family protein [Candidatus Litorirhabdus singularis]